jgi:ketosteroid isomerase-like protein
VDAETTIAGREARVRDIEAVLEANAAFYSAFDAGDLPAMDRLWSRTAEVACTHPGWTALSERGQIMESWQAILAERPGPGVSCYDARAHVSGGWAFVTCNESVGNNLLAATNLFVREAGAWRMMHHHASPVARAFVKGAPGKSDRIH